MNKLNIKQISLKDRNLLLLKDDMFTISLEHNNFYEEHFTNFAKLVLKEGDVALEGMSENIKKYKPYIFIEIESKQLLKFNVNPEDLIKYIKYELKYNLYRIYVNDSSTKYNNYMTDDFICIPNDIFFDFEKYKYELLKYE